MVTGDDIVLLGCCMNPATDVWIPGVCEYRTDKALTQMDGTKVRDESIQFAHMYMCGYVTQTHHKLITWAARDFYHLQ